MIVGSYAASPSNEAKELHELIVELKLPIRAVVEHGLGVTSSMFYAWRDKAVLITPERRAQMRDLIDTLTHYRDTGVLPVSKDELIWAGLVAVTEKR